MYGTENSDSDTLVNTLPFETKGILSLKLLPSYIASTSSETTSFCN